MATKIKGSKGAPSWPRSISAGSANVKVYEVKAPSNASGRGYVLAWTTPAGRKTQAFADADAAIAEGRIKAAQLAQGRVEGADMTRGDRDDMLAARAITGNVPLLAALREWARVRDLTQGHAIAAAEAWAARNVKSHTRITVRDALAAYVKAKTALKKKSATMHASTFKRIKADFGDFFMDTISAAQFNVWLNQWEHPVTRNTYRRRAVAFWRWAQRQNYLSREVKTEAELADTAHESAPEIGIISVATWRSLLGYFQGRHSEMIPALIVGGFCGLRRSEIHAQTWEDISLERKNLRVTLAKRGTPARRMVPLCDAAIEWLMQCKNRKGFICPSVEFNGKMQPALALDGIRRLAHRAQDQEGRPMFKLPENFHRHSYISHAVAATGDIARVSLDAGNSPKEINRHYRELVSEDEGKDWFAVTPAAVAKVIKMEAAS